MTLQNCDGAWMSSFTPSRKNRDWTNPISRSAYLFLHVQRIICQYEIQYNTNYHYEMVILSKIYLHHVSAQTIIM